MKKYASLFSLSVACKFYQSFSRVFPKARYNRGDMTKRFIYFWSLVFKTIRNALVMVLPVLFIGSFSVLLVYFPIQAYQRFLSAFLGGALQHFLFMIQLATLGLLPVYMTAAININFTASTQEGQKLSSRIASLISALTAFFILAGVFAHGFDIKQLSSQGQFSALIAGIFATLLFQKCERLFARKKGLIIESADSTFTESILAVRPYLCVVLIFLATNYAITAAFGVQGLQELFIKAVSHLFAKMERSFASGFLFILITSLLWCVGIHGNKVLDTVAVGLFQDILPAHIVSKTFIDTFVHIGGTGTTLALVVAIFFFAKTSSSKRLAKLSFAPALFNIGEPMVFGFPILCNPFLLVPFVVVPEACYSFAYLLSKANFLPAVQHEINWTTPVFLSGFLATGSLKAVLVQLLTLTLSVEIYAPFVILYEKKYVNNLSAALDSLVKILKHSEETTAPVTLTECEGNEGKLAKHLANDLKENLAYGFSEVPQLDRNALLMKYQPQFNSDGKCIGAEALLRWNHSTYGIIYPPLVVHLAKESGLLYELETEIFRKSVIDATVLREQYGEGFKMSVNITVSSLNDARLLPFLTDLAKRYPFKRGELCIEITEETALESTKETSALLDKIKALGFTFALDDFSMGHTSLQYLQYNAFDLVKLDGNLVRSLLENERTKEIINSIVYLSHSLGFTVLAEFVETKEQQQALESIGVKLYQGYFYSPAISRESLYNAARSFSSHI